MKKVIFIHPSANIAKGVKIGSETKIWLHVQIRENSIIGKKNIISKGVYIDKNVKIGNFCKIQNNVSVYDGVTIGNNVFVGPHVCFTNDKVPRAFNKNWKTTFTRIEDGVSIGANSTIVCGIKLGKFCMVAAGSVVTKDVDAYTLVAGNPARYMCKIKKDGTKKNEK
jgi:UDP-2-acetamido-3-amino-2,3-dideoxy-glucuronate N-acetyltransferase